jgi:hypothetical protein
MILYLSPSRIASRGWSCRSLSHLRVSDSHNAWHSTLSARAGGVPMDLGMGRGSSYQLRGPGPPGPPEPLIQHQWMPFPLVTERLLLTSFSARLKNRDHFRIIP